MLVHPSVHPAGRCESLCLGCISTDRNDQGTRLHVYKWLDIEAAREQADPDKRRALPVLVTEKKWTKKVHQGWPMCPALDLQNLID